MSVVPEPVRVPGWHTLPEDMVYPYPPPSRVPLKVGDVVRVADYTYPPLWVIGRYERLIDALDRTLGPVVCRVEYSGLDLSNMFYYGYAEMKILAMGNVNTLIHEWICDIAEYICIIGRVEDSRTFAAIDCKRRWLRGEATDEELAAAHEAADQAAIKPYRRGQEYGHWEAVRITEGPWTKRRRRPFDLTESITTAEIITAVKAASARYPNGRDPKNGRRDPKNRLAFQSAVGKEITEAWNADLEERVLQALEEEGEP
jgi:hypothetical protein